MNYLDRQTRSHYCSSLEDSLTAEVRMNPQKVIIAMPVEDDFMPSISRWGHGYT